MITFQDFLAEETKPITSVTKIPKELQNKAFDEVERIAKSKSMVMKSIPKMSIPKDQRNADDGELLVNVKFKDGSVMRSFICTLNMNTGDVSGCGLESS